MDFCAIETNKITQQVSQQILPERTMLEGKGGSNITIKSEQKFQEKTFEEAIKQFVTAAELMLSFCPDNKRVNCAAIKKWLIESLRGTIKKFKRE